jgi:hypothetical protein
MGRTLHYRTKQAATAEELKLLRRIENKYNRLHEWKRERIKLWSSNAGDPLPKAVLWGFTKVADDKEGKLVVQAIKEMSKVTPRLTWRLYDEGGLTGGKIAVMRKGNLIESRNYVVN